MEVLSVFSLISAAASTGGAQIGKAVAIRGASKFLGGVVGLAFSLPEAITNWENAIKNRHETEASKSLRDTAEKTDQARRNLSHNLSQIQKVLEEAVQNHQRKTSSASRSFKLKRESSDEYLDVCQPKMFKPCNSSSSPPSDEGGSSSSRDDDEDSDSSSSSSSGSSSSSSSSDEDVVLRMAVLNARSVNKLIKKADSALKKLIQDNNLDVLLITETWLGYSQNVDEFKKILLPNYKVFSVPRGYGRGEAWLLFAQKNGILVLNIYHRPQHYLEFFYELEKLLAIVFHQYKVVVIGGDFNIWVDCPKNCFSRRFREIMDKNCLIQHVSEPTHRRGHILDLVQTRTDVKITNVSVKPNSFSDHFTVFFNVHFRSQHAIRSPRSVARQRAKEKKKREKMKDRRKK
ncbi:hypothetical protein WMY93_001791 [Mugilogobius chulae]|uniref:Endonuclease/exonuclease/phosphatase domain-containing protein n=1 Tax=Mugilogobius chulae TaxID=88201 RepID=A0AAW0Q0B3_9GOBI